LCHMISLAGCSLVNSRWQREPRCTENEGVGPASEARHKTTEINTSLSPLFSPLQDFFFFFFFYRSRLAPLLSTPGPSRPGNVPAARCLTWTDRTATVASWTSRRTRAVASSCAVTSSWTRSRGAWFGSWTTRR